MSERTVIAKAGARFGSENKRQRRIGPIAGCAVHADAPPFAGFESALEPGTQFLSHRANTPKLVADFDACVFRGQPITDLAQWRQIVDANALSEVEGAFVLAWFDDATTLHLARDPIGHRTLYYAVTRHGLLFSSSLQSLVASGAVTATLNPLAIAAYLAYAYVPGERTLLDGIHELLPGEVVHYAHALERRRFWSLPAEPRSESQVSETELIQSLRRRLEATLTQLIPQHEPVGASLSGGVDSSLVVALTSRLLGAQLPTFSISFGEGYKNELQFSSLVARHCGTRHQIVELPAAAVVAHLDDTIALLGKPIGDPLTVPNALLFREVSSEVSVLLNGEGGDPCFGGPKNIPMVLAELFGDFAETSAAADLLRRERSYLRAHQKCFDDLKEMLTPEFYGALPQHALESEISDWFNDERWPSFVNKLMALNVTFKGGHHILPKVDALSSKFGVLARSPLFARGIVEQAFSIPPQLKLKQSVEKYALKRAVADLLPAVILERPKSGMLVPVEGWFSGPLLPFARERLLDGLRQYRIFDPRFLERLIAGKLGGLRPRRGVKIWLLLTLESWLRSLPAKPFSSGAQLPPQRSEFFGAPPSGFGSPTPKR